MKFFTDKTVENDFLLIKYYDYIKKNVDWNQWKEVFIDPGVWELKKQQSYSWEKDINIIDFINSLPKNHYFSVDYPCNMNVKYTNHFIQKSWDNALKYHNYPNYIVTVQSKFNNYRSFMDWFDKYNKLNIKSGIMGLGNLCRIQGLTKFMKYSLMYAFLHCNHPRIHIYGLTIRVIPFASRLANKFNIELSIDSTNWTRACSVKLKEKYNINCTTKTRQIFFNEYLKLIESKGIVLENEFKK